MDYEKKYKEALERAKEWYNDSHITIGLKGNLKDIFPELAISEDEKISKEIIKYLEQTVPHHHRDEVLKSKEWIAWLEKQGETFTKKDVDDAYLKGICTAKQELEKQGEQKQYDIDVLEKHITKDSISELAHTVIVRNGWEIVNAKEQKSAEWGEEDKEFINDLIGIFDGQQYQAHSDEEIVKWLKSIRLPYNKEWNKNDEEMLKSIIATCELACEDRDSSPARHLLQMQTDWLKSLKDRITWKPSEEQIVVLELASKYERVFTPKQIDILIDLKEQLKKLIE